MGVSTCKLTRQYERDLIKGVKKNPKAFWKYAQSKTKSRSGINDLEKGDGGLTQSDEEKADVLNTFFTSVFTQEDLTNIPTLEDRDFSTPLQKIEISVDEVEKKLKNLKTGKSPGPDGLHPRALSEVAEAISVPIAMICEKSLLEGCLPQDWKRAHVTPIFKKGIKKQAGNYRPVSLTCIVCKVMETII